MDKQTFDNLSEDSKLAFLYEEVARTNVNLGGFKYSSYLSTIASHESMDDNLSGRVSHLSVAESNLKAGIESTNQKLSGLSTEHENLVNEIHGFIDATLRNNKALSEQISFLYIHLQEVYEKVLQKKLGHLPPKE